MLCSGRRWTEVELGEEDSSPGSSAPTPEGDLPPFRGRASTDGHLLSRPQRWRYPPPAAARSDRRMSISMRGNNASC